MVHGLIVRDHCSTPEQVLHGAYYTITSSILNGTDLNKFAKKQKSKIFDIMLPMTIMEKVVSFYAHGYQSFAVWRKRSDE